MKASLVLAVALGLGVSTVQAIKLNPEAMRAMQAEGEKIVEQAMQPRTFRLSSGMCLTRAQNGNVVLAACVPNEASQVWRYDEHGRVLQNNGSCLAVDGQPGAAGANVVTKGCDGTPHFKWKPNRAGQLVNNGTACLHAAGDFRAPGANVILSACAGGDAQIWR